MKKNRMIKRLIPRAVAIVLMLATLCVCVVSCSEYQVKDPVLEYGEHKISLAMYEFMLSRMKGSLARNKYDVNSEEFWSKTHAGTDMTNEEYYHDSILTTCKNYLAALIMFEQNGYTLPESTLADIDEEISFYIDYDGKGETERFNALLAKYGVTAEDLKQIYIVEEKYQYLIKALYGANGSLISDAVKQKYYEENYYRCKQILVSDFYYKYEKDEQGNIIYYDPENGEPLYDMKNGEYIYNDDGNMIRDSYGNVIYYDADGKILYDTVKGYPSAVLDDNGEAVKYYYTDEEKAEREERMQEFLDSVKKGNYSAFESEMQNWQLYERAEDYYTDGYYLSRIESAGYDEYMFDILEALEEMDEGEIRVIDTEYGHHIIMKYELDEGKFAQSGYAEWFASFNSSLITKLFLDKCESFYSKISVNEENLAKARSIKSIGTNFDY